jgi:crossover junction endodeoxyribonuclease RusA
VQIVEFTITGVPVSAQARASSARDTWRRNVQEAGRKAFGDEPLLSGDLGIKIRGFSDGYVRPDLDNLTKPILDALQGVIYQNDHGFIDLDVKFRTLSEPITIYKVSSVLTAAFETGFPFVYVRVQNDVDRTVIT